MGISIGILFLAVGAILNWARRPARVHPAHLRDHDARASGQRSVAEALSTDAAAEGAL